MTNPFEIEPTQPPKPAIETSPKPSTEVVPTVGSGPLEIPEHLQPPKLTDAERRAAIARLNAGFPDDEPLSMTMVADGPSEKNIENIEQFKALHALFEAFERNHSLEALWAITEITPAEIVKHPLRRPAANDLITIRKMYDAIENWSDIPVVRRDEMNERYKRITRAVGMYSALEKRVDHDRI